MNAQEEIMSILRKGDGLLIRLPLEKGLGADDSLLLAILMTKFVEDEENNDLILDSWIRFTKGHTEDLPFIKKNRYRTLKKLEKLGYITYGRNKVRLNMEKVDPDKSYYNAIKARMKGIVS